MKPRDTMTPEEVREWRAKVEAGTLFASWAVPEHGSVATYSDGCRCDACREVKRSYQERFRAAHKGAEPPRHGTRYAYTQYACRCSDCTAANKEASRLSERKRSLRRQASPSPGRPPGRNPSHGTAYGYGEGCRCTDCRAANAARTRSYIAKVNGTPPPQHGTAYAYRTYSCRCQDCTAANTEASREYRRQRQEGKR